MLRCCYQHSPLHVGMGLCACVREVACSQLDVCDSQVLRKVRPLFEGEDDLMSEFVHYLPSRCLHSGHLHIVIPPDNDHNR